MTEEQKSKPFTAPSDGWREPKPLPDGLLPVASFDSAFMPKALAPWIDDVSDCSVRRTMWR